MKREAPSMPVTPVPESCSDVYLRMSYPYGRAYTMGYSMSKTISRPELEIHLNLSYYVYFGMDIPHIR